MNNLIWIKCCGNYNKLINKINTLGLSVYEIKYKDDCLYLKIVKDDYPKFKKFLPSYKLEIDRKLGFAKILDIISNYYYIVISLIVGLIFLIFLSHIIVKVEVIHSSKEVRNLLYNALEEEGIKRLSFKKSYEEISLIKEKILKKYENELEWIEIEVHGMKYVIRVEQRIITKDQKEKNACHIIALKSGVITDIITINGEALVTRGNYVTQGDVLISGNILFNNELKNVVCAKGVVKAEVWYTVKVSMPLSYDKEYLTNKKRYNIVFDSGLGKTSVFRNRLKSFKSKDKKIFSFLGKNYYVRTMQEIKKESLKYDEEEAFNEAMILALEKININKKNKDKIITQKVLKKEINDSTINLEVFFAIEEDIGKVEEFINSDEVE